MTTPTVTGADRERAARVITVHVNAACTCGGGGPDDGCPACRTYHGIRGPLATLIARDRETLEAAKDEVGSLRDALGTVREALDRFDANLAFMDDGVVLLGTRASQAKTRVEALEATLGVESGLLVDAKQRIEELQTECGKLRERLGYD